MQNDLLRVITNTPTLQLYNETAPPLLTVSLYVITAEKGCWVWLVGLEAWEL